MRVTLDAVRRRTIWQIALLSAGFLVLVAISTTSIYLVNQARNDASWVVHTVEVEGQISLAQLQIRSAESAIRGYLLYGEERYGAEFEEADNLLNPVLAKLQNLTSDNPLQAKALAEFVPRVKQRFDDFRRALSLARAGKFDEAKAFLRDSSMRQEMNRVRDLASEMRDEEDRLFQIRTRAADRSQTIAAMVTTAGSGVVLALAGISIFLVRRSSRARDDAEQRLRDNNMNLEAAVDERTADLREANEEIQRFAYIVSHDLRSPLVNIMGFTSELEELRTDIFSRIARYSRAAAATPAIPEPIGDADPANAPELQAKDKQLSQDFSEALGFIKSSIGKMDRLISAILNLTRKADAIFTPCRSIRENLSRRSSRQSLIRRPRQMHKFASNRCRASSATDLHWNKSSPT